MSWLRLLLALCLLGPWSAQPPGTVAGKSAHGSLSAGPGGAHPSV